MGSIISTNLMKKLSFLSIIAICMLFSFQSVIAQSGSGNNTGLSGIDANERQRIKEDLKQELRKELLQAIREENEAERQKKLELDRLKEEIRRELIKEMRQEVTADKQLREQLRAELLQEMRQENRNNSSLREELRRELQEELRKEVTDSRKETSRDRRDRNREEKEDDKYTDSQRPSKDRSRQDKEHATRSERRDARRDARKEEKEEERKYRLKFERGRQKGTSFGVMAGVNLSNFREKQETNISSDQLAGFLAGGYLRFSTKVVYFQPEVLYSGKGSNFGFKEGNGDASKNTRLRINSLDIPLMFGLKVFERRKVNLRLVAGPLVSVFLGTNGKDNNIKDEDFQRLAAGYQVGAGMDFGNLTLDFRYEGSFSNLNTKTGRDGIFEGNNLRNSIFRATVGFRIF